MPDSVRSLAAGNFNRPTFNQGSDSRVALNKDALIEIDFNKTAWETA